MIQLAYSQLRGQSIGSLPRNMVIRMGRDIAPGSPGESAD
jgi:hypothetical protein